MHDKIRKISDSGIFTYVKDGVTLENAISICTETAVSLSPD
jgi:hypothetical protein